MDFKILEIEYVIKNGVNFNDLEGDLDTDRILQPETEDEGFTGLTYELYKDGSLAYYCFYKDGEEHGEHIEFHKNGRIKSYKVKDYGAISGEYQFWDEFGNVIEQGEGSFGLKLRYTKWNSDGVMIEQKEEPSKADIEWVQKRSKDREESLKRFEDWKNRG